MPKALWIPASAGMTKRGDFQRSLLMSRLPSHRLIPIYLIEQRAAALC